MVMNDQDAVQGIFDFDAGNPDGLLNWRLEQERRLAAVRRVWHMPLGRQVRVSLCNIDDDLVGKLELHEYPARLDHRAPLHLRIGKINFWSTEIEQCLVVESAG
jgi:hypothetical protein